VPAILSMNKTLNKYGILLILFLIFVLISFCVNYFNLELIGVILKTSSLFTKILFLFFLLIVEFELTLALILLIKNDTINFINWHKRIFWNQTKIDEALQEKNLKYSKKIILQLKKIIKIKNK